MNSFANVLTLTSINICDLQIKLVLFDAFLLKCLLLLCIRNVFKDTTIFCSCYVLFKIRNLNIFFGLLFKQSFVVTVTYF